MPRTRLAPSPTGALHLGNARTFLINWAMARQRGWRVVLRIDDLDGPRIKAGAVEEAVEDLRWLGIDWDEGPYNQRSDLAPYRAALERLADLGAIYPCRCTRREIEAASLSAPHVDQHELRYPGACRPATPQPIAYNPPYGPNPASPNQASPNQGGPNQGGQVAWRLRVPAGSTTFVDSFAGTHVHDVGLTCGDFLVATKEGLPSYQLAVVVDDARQGVDRIVRGDDLLSSTHRQRLLIDLLGLTPPAEFFHLPLVVGRDGRRLAKRHGDTRVSCYRELGVPAERLVGLVADWCGAGRRAELSAHEFVAQFDLQRLPRAPVVFCDADDLWLRRSSAVDPHRNDQP